MCGNKRWTGFSARKLDKNMELLQLSEDNLPYIFATYSKSIHSYLSSPFLCTVKESDSVIFTWSNCCLDSNWSKQNGQNYAEQKNPAYLTCQFVKLNHPFHCSEGVCGSVNKTKLVFQLSTWVTGQIDHVIVWKQELPTAEKTQSETVQLDDST